MPLPILPIAAGAALVALVGAGSAERASAGMSTNTPTNVAPTQQSTGGENGGAQQPSHSDFVAEPTADAGGTSTPSMGGPTEAQITNMFGAGASEASGEASTGGKMIDPVRDPWGTADPSGTSFTKPANQVDAVKVALGAGAITVKQAGAAFSAWGSALGAVW